MCKFYMSGVQVLYPALMNGVISRNTSVVKSQSSESMYHDCLAMHTPCIAAAGKS